MVRFINKVLEGGVGVISSFRSTLCNKIEMDLIINNRNVTKTKHVLLILILTFALHSKKLCHPLLATRLIILGSIITPLSRGRVSAW